MTEQIRLPRSVSDDNLSNYLAKSAKRQRILAVAEMCLEGVHLVFPTCSLEGVRPHLERLFPGFVIVPLPQASETTFHIYRNHKVLCAAIPVGALLGSVFFVGLIDKHFRMFSRDLYVRDQINEDDWQRHVRKAGDRGTEAIRESGGHLALRDWKRLLTGVCGELLLEVGMKLFAESIKRAGVQGFRTIRGKEGERIDADRPRPGLRLRKSNWLSFTSPYNCELWGQERGSTRRLAEFDLMAVASHASNTTLYLFDATTSTQVPIEKAHKHHLLTQRLEEDNGRSVETIIVNFIEEEFAELPREPNLRLLSLPLRGVVEHLCQVTMDTLMQDRTFAQVTSRIAGEMQ